MTCLYNILIYIIYYVHTRRLCSTLPSISCIHIALYCETNQCALVMASLIGYSECLRTCVGILIDVLSVL